MSVTFSPDVAFPARPNFPCPECGGTMQYQRGHVKDALTECGTCVGYGGDSDAEYAWETANCPPSLNVANGNAAFIVQEILNISVHEADIYCHAVAAHEVLLRIALYFDTSRGVAAPSTEQTVKVTYNGVEQGATYHFCGRTEEQVKRYLASLQAIAEYAAEHGAEVSWC